MKKGIVAYDLKVTKHRTYLSEILKEFGERVQFSIFEFEVTQDEFKVMKKKIIDFYKEYEDYLVTENIEDKCKSVRIYINCDMCSKKKLMLGNAHSYLDENIIII